MARKIAPVDLDGKTIWIEVEEIEITTPQGGKDTGEHPDDLRDSATPTSATDTLKDKAASVSETLETLISTIGRGLDKAGPNEWTVEVSIGLEGEKNIPFIAKAGINGGIKVSATWKGAQAGGE